MTDRRDRLRQALNAALVGRAGGSPAATDDGAVAFNRALAETPWLIGWAGRDRDAVVDDLTVEGRMPPDLGGMFYRNGPARHEVGGLRYRHWFDGDGFVQAFRFAHGRVSFRGRFVATAKRRAESAAGRALMPTFDTLPPGAAAMADPDAMNVANIHVLPLGDRLLALWEGGSAHDLDPDTLDTRGIHVWRPDLAGLPFSAHPKVEPDGTVWNFGLSLRDGRLWIYRIDPDGRLHSASAIDAGQRGMMHDFAVTRRHLLFLMPPFLAEDSRDPRPKAVLDRFGWHPDRPTLVLVVDKDDPTRRRRYELPPGFGFHFTNAWEEADGTIRFLFHMAADASVLTQALRRVMRGEVASFSPTRPLLAALHPDGRADVIWPNAPFSEFPTVDPRVVGLPTRHAYQVERTGTEIGFRLNAVVRRDLAAGAEDRFDFGRDVLAEEHIVVPRPAATAEGDGWLIGTVLDVARRRTAVTVFDALRLADGPVARAWLPFALPLGFHGRFRPA
jgi:all-trans-8'-apo-beta-carotenal 15,15'-oxygenase